MKRFFSTYLTQVLSQCLYCLIAIVWLGDIAGGQGESVGASVTAQQLFFKGLYASLLLFLPAAALHTLLYRAIGNRAIRLVLCGLVYVLPWFWVSYLIVEDFMAAWGTTWSGLEFFIFYFGNWRLPLGLTIVFAAYAVNLVPHRRFDGRR